ncbi:MAG: DUF192 domain-containing protein [Candidatus Aenigmatarchaeota archaeon]|nr:DUF192 domain-containing protein [Nanoarchaeota archaeon]
MSLFNKIGRQDRISNCVLFITADRRNISLPVEIISDASARSLGSTELQHTGVAYKFPTEGVIQFLMSNVESPIDIIFANREKEITHVERNVYMEGMGKGMLVTSKRKASYVLELPGGFTSRNNINAGDRLSILG